MTWKSDDISELAAALAVAQSELDFAKKDASNPFFKSSYADLASVWDVCRMVLPKNGIAVSQILEPHEQSIFVRTLLMHKSGQWLASELTLPPVKQDPQAYGSAITYARRYSLAAIVGVVADDDDGEGAMGRGKPGKDKGTKEPLPQPHKPASVAPIKNPATRPQLQKMFAEAHELGIADERLKQRIKDTYGVESTKELTSAEATQIIEWLIDQKRQGRDASPVPVDEGGNSVASRGISPDKPGNGVRPEDSVAAVHGAELPEAEQLEINVRELIDSIDNNFLSDLAKAGVKPERVVRLFIVQKQIVFGDIKATIDELSRMKIADIAEQMRGAFKRFNIA